MADPIRVRAEDVDLSSLEFWQRPLEEREAAFAALRRERPIGYQKEFEPPPGVGLTRGPGYWALVRHAEILEVSRRPDRSAPPIRMRPVPCTPKSPHHAGNRARASAGT